jgi:putative transposase
VARSTLGYVSPLIARDAPVLPAVRTWAGQYPRYGYRTIRIFLERQGHVLGTDRMYRLWRQEGLQVPKKRPRRRVATGWPRPLAPTAVNHVWAYDFVFDTCADGRTLKCLTVIDEVTRECLAIGRRHSVRPCHRSVEAARERAWAPRYLRSDNGPEFVATAILRWLQTAQIETAFIDPGKPWQNGADESFATNISRCSGSAIAPTRR